MSRAGKKGAAPDGAAPAERVPAEDDLERKRGEVREERERVARARNERETFNRLLEEARLLEAAEHQHDPDAVCALLARFVQSPMGKDAGIAERFVRDALACWTEARQAGRSMSFDSAFSLQPRHGETRTHDPRVVQTAALRVFMRSRPGGGDLHVKVACREVAKEMRIRADEVQRFYKHSTVVKALRDAMKQSGGAKASRAARCIGRRDAQDLERAIGQAQGDTPIE